MDAKAEVSKRSVELMPKQFHRWAVKQRYNLHKTEDGNDFVYEKARHAWAAWSERSRLAAHAEGDVIRNKALQDASEVAFAMAGQDVAQAIQQLKRPID